MTSNDESRRDQAYRKIWQRIVHLDYAPLTLLNEKQLSAELDVGLSPVREALRCLEYDGLVMILPRRGTLTTEIGLTDVQSELEVRIELEGLAGRLAAQRGSDAEHERLARHIQQMTDLCEKRENGHRNIEFTDMDGEFHRQIYAQTKNKSLVRDLDRHFAHALRIWFYCHRLRNRMPVLGVAPGAEQIENYREVSNALCRRDAAAAEAGMRKHVMRDTERVLALLNQAD